MCVIFRVLSVFLVSGQKFQPVPNPSLDRVGFFRTGWVGFIGSGGHDQVQLAHQWCHSSVILESNCFSCVAALTKHVINRSIYASLEEDSKNIMRMLGNVCLVKINREQNTTVLDELSSLRFG